MHEENRILVGTPEKIPPGRSRRKKVDTSRVDLREIGRGGMNWICLVYDRDQCRTVVNKVTEVQVL
jgi:5-methylthioribose kinase